MNKRTPILYPDAATNCPDNWACSQNRKQTMYEFTLLDDGTLDTVIGVHDPVTDITQEFRYGLDLAAEYRDETGCLDLDRFIDDIVGPDADTFDWVGLNLE